MGNYMDVIVTLGPSVFIANDKEAYKYATIGIKWKLNDIQDEKEFLDKMISKIKDEFVIRALRFPNKTYDISESNDDKFSKFEKDGIIYLTDEFFEYLKNNETKIEAIRVSLDDYKQDWIEKKLKTLKTQMVVVTADTESLNNMFENLVKELYYEYGDKVIDIYSIILTPKMYKMINNIPIEYRGLLVRVKK